MTFRLEIERRIHMIDTKLQNIEYLRTLKENQYFDRKSARVKPLDILKHLTGFANAGGGVLVIGIEDNGAITGFKCNNAHSIDEFKEIALVKLTATPISIERMELPVINVNGEEDSVLVLSVSPSYNRVIHSYDNSIYLRFGDKTQELNAEQVLQLKYDKGEQFFEEELSPYASINDLDMSLVKDYREKAGVTESTDEEMLRTIGCLRDSKLTNAGILLFAKHPTQFLPQARLRFIRYDGSQAKVGTEINIVKEKTFDGPIPRIIQEAKEFISAQFREFQYLDKTGQFRRMPEYPEFAWFEGIVNALTHRNYSIRGEHTKVIMYDDRLEILSPGILPNIVTLENIRFQRFSRNPRIARVLSEYGWVKEMNEGVKRIYSEMEKAFLNDPLYSQPGNNVLLILENNILNRTMRNLDSLAASIGADNFKQLSADELLILQYAFNAGRIDAKTGSAITRHSVVFARQKLKKLASLGFLEWHGSSKNDPTQYYSFSAQYK